MGELTVGLMQASSQSVSNLLVVGRRLNWKTVLVALVLLVGAVAGGYYAYTCYWTPAVVPIAGTPVTVRKGTIASTVSSTGSVVSNRASKLSLQVSGRLVSVPVKLGDAVKAGTVLASVDNAPLQLKLEQAENELQTSRIKLDQLRSGSRQEDITQAESAIVSAQARLVDVQAGSTVQDLSQAQSGVDSAAASIRQSQAKLDQLRAGPTAAEVATAEQSVANATGMLQKAQIALETTKSGPKQEEIRIAELAIEQAKNSLWSQQLSRDATCGRGAGGTCDAGKASVAAAESSVTQAREKLKALMVPPDARILAAHQADIDSAQESVRSAQIKLEQVKAGVTQEEIRQAQAGLDSAQAGYKSATAKLEGLRQGSKASDIETAKNALVQSEQQLALKKTPYRPQDIQLAEQQVKTSELTLRQAKLDLSNTTLTAPFDGVIGAVSGNVGEQIGTSTVVMTLVDPSSSRVDMTVDESDISKIAPGKPAQITFDALPEKRYAGKVMGVAPSSTLTQGVATYTIAVSIDNGDQTVPIGMTANVSITTDRKSDVLVLPNRAIKRTGRIQVVDIMVDGKTESRTVTTGVNNDQLTEIVTGVKEGDEVLIAGTTTTQPRVPGFGGGPPGGGGAPPAAAKVVAR